MQTLLAQAGSNPTTPATNASQSRRGESETIQRTIEEENSQGLTPTQVTAESQAEQSSSNSVIYGLGAVILLIVAIGAAVAFMKNKK